MGVSKRDRDLVKRCLANQSGAWKDFVDRNLALIYHVIQNTAFLRSVPLQPGDVEDLVADILLQIVSGDFAILRNFKGESSLATYLAVIARRICVHKLANRAIMQEKTNQQQELDGLADRREKAKTPSENLEDIESLLKRLHGKEKEVVRLRFMEGRSYEEVSSALHIPVNSIGPILARAQQKMKKQVKNNRQES